MRKNKMSGNICFDIEMTRFDCVILLCGFATMCIYVNNRFSRFFLNNLHPVWLKINCIIKFEYKCLKNYT